MVGSCKPITPCATDRPTDGSHRRASSQTALRCSRVKLSRSSLPPSLQQSKRGERKGGASPLYVLFKRYSASEARQAVGSSSSVVNLRTRRAVHAFMVWTGRLSSTGNRHALCAWWGGGLGEGASGGTLTESEARQRAPACGAIMAPCLPLCLAIFPGINLTPLWLGCRPSPMVITGISTAG